MSASGLKIQSQVPVPSNYKGLKLDFCYRLDLLVEDQVIVELKSIDETSKVHKAQLLTYLKLTNKNVGLLINFNTVILTDGVLRVVHGGVGL